MGKDDIIFSSLNITRLDFCHEVPTITFVHGQALPCIVQQLRQRSKKETVRGADEKNRAKAKVKLTLESV